MSFKEIHLKSDCSPLDIQCFFSHKNISIIDITINKTKLICLSPSLIFLIYNIYQVYVGTVKQSTRAIW